MFSSSQNGTRSCLALLMSGFLAVGGGGCGTWIGNAEEPTEGNGNGTSQKAVISLNIKGSLGTNLVASSVDVIGADGTSIGRLELTEAKVALSEIKFKQESGSIDEAEFKGPYVVDLLGNQVLPAPGTLEVAAGGYDDIILKLHKVEKDDGEAAGIDATDSIIANSLYVKGGFIATDGTTKPFQMAYELSEEFSLGSGGKVIDLAAGVTQAMIIAFRLDSWFRFDDRSTNEGGVDLSDFTASDIVLNKDSEDETAKKIREAIKENIKKSADFGKDVDEDGKLEAEESHDEDK